MFKAKGVRAFALSRCLETVVLAFMLYPVHGMAQEQTEKKFHEVTLSPDTAFTYDKLSYVGDFFELTAKQGSMLTGTTAAGVTVVILLGEVQFKITPAKEEFQAKLQEAFEAAPAVVVAKQTYLRMHPEDYAALTKGSTLSKATEEKVFKDGKAVYDEKFNGSYHAGPLAIIPPAQTVFVDMVSEKFGQVILEEGDYMRLIRVAPYKSIYTSRLLNPKRWK